MFQRLKQRLRDMGTIKALCEGAERHARQEGQALPGAEHFLLAALDLPDGSARRAFERVKADPAGFRAAIVRQHREALEHAGLDPAAFPDENEALPPHAGPSLYRAQASGQAVMQGLAELRREDGETPLRGAHVLAVVAAMQQGVAARSLRAMNVDPAALAAAAKAEAAAR